MHIQNLLAYFESEKMFDTCVIGGSGFIGRVLVEQLTATGRRVMVLGRRPNSQSLPEGAEYQAVDIANTHAVKTALLGIPEIIDLAYGTVPKTSFDDPICDVLVNLPSSISLLTAASELDLRAFVVVSSGGTVYGDPDFLPITESHQLRPLSPYGITKYALERYGALYHRSKGMPIIVARPANAYGETQDGSRGQGFIGAAVRKYLDGQRIPIFGVPGTLRDYIFVSDVAKGLIAVLEKGLIGEAYNIGSGQGRNNIEIVAQLSALAVERGMVAPEIEVLPSRDFDVQANVLDSSKLHTVSGWQPQVSLSEGMARVLEYMLCKQ